MAKTVTFGEIMLRLKSPENERLFQSPLLEATFGGGEANVAVSLSIFGKESEFVTVVPDNAVGEAAIVEVRKYGVSTKNIKKNNGRLGIYYLETGACQRPSLVVYDRAESCIACAKKDDFNWSEIFTGAEWFHVTGITPAISQGAADLTIEAVQQAKKSGVKVSVDLNFRKKLWKYGKKAPEVMSIIAGFADVIIANEEDIQMCLGITAPDVDVVKGSLNGEAYRTLTQAVKKQYPNVSVVAVTLRESRSADKNGWSAVLSGQTGYYTSKKYDIDDIVDRVGGGDSFSAGLIYGLQEYGDNEQQALEFAVAASALKHTIPGDFNLSRKNEVLALAGGDGSGRVQR